MSIESWTILAAERGSAPVLRRAASAYVRTGRSATDSSEWPPRRHTERSCLDQQRCPSGAPYRGGGGRARADGRRTTRRWRSGSWRGGGSGRWHVDAVCDKRTSSAHGLRKMVSRTRFSDAIPGLRTRSVGSGRVDLGRESMPWSSRNGVSDCRLPGAPRRGTYWSRRMLQRRGPRIVLAGCRKSEVVLANLDERCQLLNRLIGHVGQGTFNGAERMPSIADVCLSAIFVGGVKS